VVTEEETAGGREVVVSAYSPGRISQFARGRGEVLGTERGAETKGPSGSWVRASLSFPRERELV